MVVLAPQLSEPLHGQRIRDYDEAAFDSACVDEPREYQAGFNRLAEADFVGQQPSHGIRFRGALGDMELMRKEAYAPAEERTEPVGLAQRQQVQDLEPKYEVRGLVCIARRKPLEEGAFELQRPKFSRHRSPLVREAQRPVGKPSLDDRFLACGDDPDVTAWTEIDRQQRVARGREPESRARARELDIERAPVDANNAPDAKLGVVAMGEVVPRFPGQRRDLLCECYARIRRTPMSSAGVGSATGMSPHCCSHVTLTARSSGARGSERSLWFPNDRSRGLVAAQTQECRVAEMPVSGPFDEPDLGDDIRIHPLERRHILGRNPFSPS